jgi:hypothetical protein
VYENRYLVSLLVFFSVSGAVSYFYLHNISLSITSLIMLTLCAIQLIRGLR